MEPAYVQLAGGLLLAAILYLLYAVTRSSGACRALPLPPGPDAAFTPGAKIPQKFAELGEMYGPVFSYRRGKQIFCVINRLQPAMDILQKHGADTIDRPRLIAANEILSGGMRTVLTGAGPRIRKLRRALQSQMQPNIVGQYLSLQMKNAKTLILNLLRDPDNHADHAKIYAASVVISMTYGKTEPSRYTDPEVQQMLGYMSRLVKYMQIGKHPVDNYPILRYLPFVAADLRRSYREEVMFYRELVDGVRQKMATHTEQPCFASYLLEHQKEYELSNNELGFLTGSMFGAGSETTSSAISWVIAAAAKYPEEAAKVQAELDVVVGRDRLPTFEDAKLLPHVRAFLWETYRWRPVAWGGVPHRSTNDIIWNGYVIPKGTIIFANNWGIRLDPDLYPDPEAFKPGRWLDEQGNFKEDMSYCTYGFGRRVCPGQHLANNSLFITTSLALWAFDISEDPAAPIDTMAFTDVATIRPLPFKAVFKPRMPVDKLREAVESHLG